MCLLIDFKLKIHSTGGGGEQIAMLFVCVYSKTLLYNKEPEQEINGFATHFQYYINVYSKRLYVLCPGFILFLYIFIYINNKIKNVHCIAASFSSLLSSSLSSSLLSFLSSRRKVVGLFSYRWARASTIKALAKFYININRNSKSPKICFRQT